MIENEGSNLRANRPRRRKRQAKDSLQQTPVALMMGRKEKEGTQARKQEERIEKSKAGELTSCHAQSGFGSLSGGCMLSVIQGQPRLEWM